MTLQDCTKKELLIVIEYMRRSSLSSGNWYLARALGEVERRREEKMLDEADKIAQMASELQKRHNELLRPYEGANISDIPFRVIEQARKILREIESLDQRYEKLLGLSPMPRHE